MFFKFALYMTNSTSQKVNVNMSDTFLKSFVLATLSKKPCFSFWFSFICFAHSLVTLVIIVICIILSCLLNFLFSCSIPFPVPFSFHSGSNSSLLVFTTETLHLGKIRKSNLKMNLFYFCSVTLTPFSRRTWVFLNWKFHRTPWWPLN